MKNFWIARHKTREKKKTEEAINNVVQMVLRKRLGGRWFNLPIKAKP